MHIILIVCLCNVWLLSSDRLKIYRCDFQQTILYKEDTAKRGVQKLARCPTKLSHQERYMLKNCRGESKERCLKKAGQTPASYFPCALSQQMYFPSVKRFLNVSISVFCLLSSSFQMYLSLYFAFFSNFKQVPNVSRAVSNCICKCILPLVHFIVPASTPDCLLQPLSDSKQQFLYICSLLIDYISSPLYFATSLLFGTIGFFSKNKRLCSRLVG